MKPDLPPPRNATLDVTEPAAGDYDEAELKRLNRPSRMPKVDGLTVLREIKKAPRLRLIPVVALTSSDRDRDLVDSYNLGVNSYIQKPADFDQFRKVVKELGYYWLLVKAPSVVEEEASTTAA